MRVEQEHKTIRFWLAHGFNKKLAEYMFLYCKQNNTIEEVLEKIVLGLAPVINVGNINMKVSNRLGYQVRQSLMHKLNLYLTT